MIKTAQDMIKALRRDTFCGVILYQGPSLIDGAPAGGVLSAYARHRRR